MLEHPCTYFSFEKSIAFTLGLEHYLHLIRVEVTLAFDLGLEYHHLNLRLGLEHCLYPIYGWYAFVDRLLVWNTTHMDLRLETPSVSAVGLEHHLNLTKVGVTLVCDLWLEHHHLHLL